jgi:hypothetical protein
MKQLDFVTFALRFKPGGDMQDRSRSIPGMAMTVITAIGLGTLSLSAQETVDPGVVVPGTASESSIARVGLGFGAGSIGSGTVGTAMRVALTLSKSQARSITIRSTFVEEFNLFGPNPAESVWDVGVLYGGETRGSRGYASASAGLALVGGMRRGARSSAPIGCDAALPLFDCVLTSMFTPTEYEEDPFVTVGIPLELEAGLTFSDSFGMGVNAFANLNAQRTSIGASLNFLLGRIR